MGGGVTELLPELMALGTGGRHPRLELALGSRLGRREGAWAALREGGGTSLSGGAGSLGLVSPGWLGETGCGGCAQGCPGVWSGARAQPWLLDRRVGSGLHWEIVPPWQ